MSTITDAAAGRMPPASLDEGGRWVAYHVFYGGSPDVLLTECLVPLAERLVSSGVVRDWFYINYWLEGSHVRLRLRVGAGTGDAEVDGLVLPEVEAYLARRPSMHPTVRLTDNGFYEQLFLGEFREEDRPQHFDETGAPLFRENNTIERRPYERETHRYGGPRGMLLSERHFVASTQLAARVLERGNQDVRGLLLGIATQLSFVTACALLRDRALVADFFVAYHRRWAAGYSDDTPYTTERGQHEHRATAATLRNRTIPLLGPIVDRDLAGMPELLRDWAEVNLATRDELDVLFAEGALEFDYQDGRRAPESPDAAAWSLCHSLIHMTNNRMMVSVSDEAFIAYQVARAMGADA
ncbi:lantibiotic dehydratase C-terminal domain-containing protein [Clavibacter capsici]|uniref:lantibiotic dehydratase C-terminal domain-containing protein n=1 Tax=Clavibacter capsici TaxID=1874630 RepID=UPI00142822D7|nr:lantibiotic dehydratase C-terminal domain-containing protein [Clavibacter capsici]QIS39782.1 hypothetical protein GW572_11790 [Clavibacter capsici]